jgi:hypothetical protein
MARDLSPLAGESVLGEAVEEPADRFQAGAQGLGVVGEADADGVLDVEGGAGGEHDAGLAAEAGADLVGTDGGVVAQERGRPRPVCRR